MRIEVKNITADLGINNGKGIPILRDNGLRLDVGETVEIADASPAFVRHLRASRYLRVTQLPTDDD